MANYWGFDPGYTPVANVSIHWAGGRTSPPPNEPYCWFKKDNPACAPPVPTGWDFFKLNKHICSLHHFSILRWRRSSNTFPMEDKDLCSLIKNQYHTCWWLGDTKNLRVRSRGIDWVLCRNVLMPATEEINTNDEVIKWKYFARYWPFVRRSHRWIPLTKASDEELWCFSLICASTNGWVKHRDAGETLSLSLWNHCNGIFPLLLSAKGVRRKERHWWRHNADPDRLPFPLPLRHDIVILFIRWFRQHCVNICAFKSLETLKNSLWPTFYWAWDKFVTPCLLPSIREFINLSTLSIAIPRSVFGRRRYCDTN